MTFHYAWKTGALELVKDEIARIFISKVEFFHLIPSNEFTMNKIVGPLKDILCQASKFSADIKIAVESKLLSHYGKKIQSECELIGKPFTKLSKHKILIELHSELSKYIERLFNYF